jgi:hypothetical protein
VRSLAGTLNEVVMTLLGGNEAVKTGDWFLMIGVLGLKIIGFLSRVATSSPPIEGGRKSFAN